MTTNSFPAVHRRSSDYGDHSRHTHPLLVSRGVSSQHMPLSLPTKTSCSSASTPRVRAPPERRDRGKSKATTTESPAPPRDSWALMAVSHPRDSSVATLENARYRLEGIPTAEHSNEDRHFMLKGDNYKVFAVFDGHDGPRAAGFASHALMDMFNSESWKSVTSAPLETQKENIPLALTEFFKETDNQFFRSIRSAIEEKRSLQAIIPPGMKSYQAYQTYPLQVARLQELEPKISGGATAVVAVICNNLLYIANVGDSRAVLVVENEKGLQQVVQLSVDHSVGNIDELHRLTSLGLDRRQLESSGRLGSQENTRSIGDYNIKEGYRDVDTLQSSKTQPGTCEPHVRCVPITRDCKYLLLMTDGVYKSIEAVFQESASIESNKVLMSILNRERENIRSFEVFSDRVVDRIRSIHEDTYKHHASKDIRSPIAVSCRKRDDMTLLIHQFSTFKHSVSN